jgi:hypothetical protein
MGITCFLFAEKRSEDISLEIKGNQSKKFQILGRHVFSLRELKTG